MPWGTGVSAAKYSIFSSNAIQNRGCTEMSSPPPGCLSPLVHAAWSHSPAASIPSIVGALSHIPTVSRGLLSAAASAVPLRDTHRVVTIARHSANSPRRKHTLMSPPPFRVSPTS